MSSSCSSRCLIRSACSAGLLLALAAAPGRRAFAQQPDEALVGELARVLAASDARAFDAPLFREAQHYPDAVVRRQAALAIGRIGDAAGTDLLVEALGDSEPTVRAAAAFGLGLVKDARAVEPLLALVRSVPAAEQGPPQAEAVTAIAKIGGDEGPAALRGLLGSGATPGAPTSPPDSPAVLAAWRAAARPPPPPRPGVPQHPGPRRGCHPPSQPAGRAQTTLGVLGGRAAVEALSARLASAVFALRRQAMIALAQADSAAGVAAAAALAGDPDWRWRSVAAEAFAAAKDRARLEAQLADGDGRVVAQALQALARVVPAPDTTLAPRARQLLGHADPAVRSVAADLLARHPTTADVDRLVQAYTRAAGDAFNDARLSAVAALRAIAPASAGGRLA